MRLLFLTVFLIVNLLGAKDCKAQGVGTFQWTNGAPNNNPGLSGAKFAVDKNTYIWYEHITGTTWAKSGDRIQQITGCAAPNYTPGKNNSLVVINSCTDPELYAWNGAAWKILIGGGGITEIDTLTNLSDISTYTGSSNFIFINNQNARGMFSRKNKTYTTEKTVNASLANRSDTDANGRVITGTGFDYNLSGAYIFGTGVSSSVYVTKVLSATSLEISKPLGTTNAALSATFSLIDSFYRVKTVNNIVYERINEANENNPEFFGGAADWSSNTVNAVTYAGFTGTDNTLAFQRAIRFACEGSGTWGSAIKLRPGGYGVKGEIIITKDNIGILGDAETSSEIIFTETSSGIKVKYFNQSTMKRIYSVILRDIRLVGCNRAATAVDIAGSNQSDFKNIHIFGFTNYAIILNDCSSSKLDKLSIAGYPSSTAKGVKLINTSTLSIFAKEYYSLSEGDNYQNSVNVTNIDSRFEAVETGIFIENTASINNNVGNITYQNSSFNSSTSTARILKVNSTDGATLFRLVNVEFAHLRLNMGTIANAFNITGSYAAGSIIDIKISDLYENTTISSAYFATSYNRTNIFSDRIYPNFVMVTGSTEAYFVNGVLITGASPFGVYTAPKGTFAVNTGGNLNYIKQTDAGSSTGWAIIPTLNANTGDPLFQFTRKYTNHLAAYNDGSLLSSSYYYVNNDLYIKATASDTLNILNTIKASATLDFPSTSAHSSSDLTTTVTGAAVGDVVTVAPPLAAISAHSCYTAWVSSANTVTVRFNHYGAGGATNPASGVFNIIVTKF